MKKKNILLIMSDEQSWDTLGCSGNKTSVTPNLDQLAEQGVSMDRCYTAYPLCCPSRSGFWTGLMPHDHHVMGNWLGIRPDLRDEGLASNFKEAGYHTIYTGKWHVPGTTPQRFHFDDCSAIPAVLSGRDRGRYIESYRSYAKSLGYKLLDGHIENLTEQDEAQLHQPGKAPCGTSEIMLEHYLETWQTGQFLQAMERRPADKPFFAVCSYNAPHFPMIVPAPYDRIVDPADVELPPNFLEGVEGKPEEVMGSGYAELYGKIDESEWRLLIAHYLGFCALIDRQVGVIVDYLKRTGQYEHTLIVFVSDHGDMMGAHGLVKKGFPLHYEEAMRVPCILVNREILPKGRKIGELTAFHDLLPTLAELTGVPVKQRIEGRSFASLLRADEGNVEPIRDYVFGETFKIKGSEQNGGGEYVDIRQFNPNTDSVNFSLRTKEFKYIFRYKDAEELYDMQKDPYENINLAGNSDQEERLKSMRRMLMSELEQSNPFLAGIVSERNRRRNAIG